MEPNKGKRLFDETGSKNYDEFFEVKPDTKRTKPNPPRNQASKAEKKTTKAAPWHQNQQFLTKFIGIKKQFSLGTGVINTDSLLLSSWNINGLRAIMTRNDIQKYFNEKKPDILCLCETKTTQESLDSEGLTKWIPSEYNFYFNCSKIKKGYSGTGVITRYKPLSVEYGMGVEKFDVEGRVINLEFEKFYLVACYVPMSGDDFAKLPMRTTEWDPAFRSHLLKLKAKKPVIVCGDLNVLHKDIDVWGEKKWAGASEEEKSNFTTLLNTGFVDTFRHKYPDVVKYSWWSTYLNQRPSNRGRRYDYILVSKELIGSVKEARIENDVYGSDHCPVEILFNPNFEPEGKEIDVLDQSPELEEIHPSSTTMKPQPKTDPAPPEPVATNTQKEPEVINID